MSIIRLNEENAHFYEDYIGCDMCQELERKYFRGIVALDEHDERPSGGIIFELHGLEEDGKDILSRIEWFREDAPGFGKMVLDEYSRMMREEGVSKSEFAIPVDKERPEKNLLKEAGFTAKLYEGDDIFVTMEQMVRMPIVKKKLDTSMVVPLEELTVRQFRKAVSKCIDMGRKGLLEDFEYLSMRWFDTHVSSCVIKDGEIAGLLLFRQSASGMLSVKLIAGFGQGAQLNIAAMMKASIERAAGIYPPDTQVVLRRHTDATILLTEKLFPTTIGYPVYRGERAEN